MRVLGFVAVLALLAPVSGARAQTAADSAAIVAAATDYIQGWYEADAPRMQRALHPGLAKRIVVTDPATQRNVVHHTSAAQLVQDTGENEKAPPARQRKDITILDIFETMAAVKIIADGWVDYMHLGKVNGNWVIVNVMWADGPVPQAGG